MMKFLENLVLELANPDQLVFVSLNIDFYLISFYINLVVRKTSTNNRIVQFGAVVRKLCGINFNFIYAFIHTSGRPAVGIQPNFKLK